MSQNDDRAFIRRFSGIIVGLIIVTAIIIAFAVSMRSEPDPANNPSHARLAEERTEPVADVLVGEEGQAALAAIASETQAQSGAIVAEVGEIDGQQVYQSVCMACHAAGVAGAPMPGSDLMAQRMADKGMDGLVASVINGLNVMPPRGGRSSLSDEEIQAAVQFMQQ